MTPEQTFRAKAPVLMTRLMKEFPWDVLDAAACAGNLGHESLGFTKLQEMAPTVKGSRGGYGWGQWTGLRRRDFENFCAKGGLNISSDEANIAFLIFELKTTERPAVEKTKGAKGLKAKVEAFEMGYERAGVKHYPSRLKWAEIALDAFQKAQGVNPAPTPPIDPPTKPAAPPPLPEAPKGTGKPSIGQVMLGVVAAIIAAIVAYFMKG